MKHNLIAPLRSTPPLRRIFSAISIILSFVFALAAFGVQQGTSWTYQGQLRRSGAAYTGTCNFQFSLWDAVSAGTQQGSTLAINSVNVANGLFTVVLDFGDQFKGDARWLGTNVQCSGDGGFTQLDPRQPITAAPYALSLRPGASITDNTDDRAALTGQNLSPIGYGLTGLGNVGVLGQSFDNSGVGVNGIASGFNASGVNGSSSGQNGFGVDGSGGPLATAGVRGRTFNSSGSGVYGSATGANAAGVFGENSAGAGIWGRSTGAGSAVYGENTSTGYAGRFTGPVDVAGKLTVNTSSGEAITGTVTGTSSVGVFGVALLANTAGVFGRNRDSAAIWGQSTGAGSAVYGENNAGGYAGRFQGPVHVQGTLTKSAGTFKIDHPLDPANKFLSHSFVESPDMMNIYNGNLITDANGSATVTLPDYFAALNRDCRYQLTVLGQFAQAIVSREIAGNSFEIQTDKPGVKVSWQVTGIRQDAYAKEHPIVVEDLKPAEQQGLYLYPAGFGAGEEKRIGYSSRPAAGPGAQDSSGAEPSDQESK
jgi:hypothetical protein